MPIQRILVGILLVAIVAVIIVKLSQRKPSETPPPATGKVEEPGKEQLQITDSKVGTGAEAKSGDIVSVHYTGWLMDGTKFDSSLDRKMPFQFHLGQSQVIMGWDQGVQGMKVGGVRQLIIPPALAYGEKGAGNVIPPKSTLKFEIELLNVTPLNK